MVVNLVGDKDGVAAANLGAPSSSRLNRAARVSDYSIVAIHPAAECELVPRVATELTTGLQPVTHVASDTEVTTTNNNSIQQLAPHVAVNIPSTIEDPNNSGPQDGSDGDWKHAAMLGLANCGIAISALVKKPPSSSEPVYLVAEVIIFTAGILEMLGALWVSCDARNRRTAERMILYASFVSSILGLVLSFYAGKAE